MPKGPRKQTTEPILRTAILTKKKTVTTGWMGKHGLSANINAQFLSVDFIGKKKQVILELPLNPHIKFFHVNKSGH